MTEETENIVLEMLRRIRASQERMELDISDLKSRLTAVEITMGQIVSLLAGQSGRMDRIEERLARVERRLELADA